MELTRQVAGRSLQMLGISVEVKWPRLVAALVQALAIVAAFCFPTTKEI